VTFDLAEGRVEAEGKKCTTHPLSPRMQEILAAGGLVNYWRASE
jgi:methanogen homoaconitase small subunit